MDQAVIVKFKYEAQGLDALHALEDRLTETLTEEGFGECDGHAITPDLKQATIYLYGPDAEAVFVSTQHLFEGAECVHNAVATIRYGPPEEGVKERQVKLIRNIGQPNLRPW